MNKNKLLTALTALMLSGAVIFGAAQPFSAAVTPYYISSQAAASEQDNTRAFVERLYNIVLGRNADAVGLNKWVTQLENGEKTAAEIVYGFVFSPEYTGRKTSDAEFVRMLYATLFDREADGAGFESWCSRLSLFSRRYVLRGFICSDEFSKLCSSFGVVRGTLSLTENRDKDVKVTEFTANLYRQMLGRNFDVAGLNNWTGIILSGKKSLTEIILDFMDSSEFKAKNSANRDYVTSLYKGILGRNPDAAGLESWTQQLDKGKSRFAVFLGSVKSDEFRKNCSQYGLDAYIGDLNGLASAVRLIETSDIYTDASAASASSGVAYANQILSVTGIKNGWLRVAFQNGTGYIQREKVEGYDGSSIRILPVTNIPQNSYVGGAPLPTGCEITSLSVLLNYLGFTDAGKNNLAYNYMPRGAVGATDPDYAFIGDPAYSSSYGAYSNAIVKAANNYLSDVGADDYTVRNISGTSVSGLISQIKNGNPVLVWHTMGCTYIRTYGATWYLSRGTAHTQSGSGTYSFTWKNNEHCSVLVGFNESKRTVILADVFANGGAPTGGLTEYSISAFESGYSWLGSQSVIIEKQTG